MFAMDSIIQEAVLAALNILFPGKCPLLSQGQLQTMVMSSALNNCRVLFLTLAMLPCNKVMRS